jgi:hypothetical protein
VDLAATDAWRTDPRCDSILEEKLRKKMNEQNKKNAKTTNKNKGMCFSLSILT